MGSQEKDQSQVLLPSSSSSPFQSSIIGLREKHCRELENLSLTIQPLKTLKFFILAVIDCVQQQIIYISARRSWFILLSLLVIISGILVRIVFKPDEEFFLELYNYLHFGIWWLALGVASSIGLGSGLHTFVLYLGPHIALFTMKSVQCGHVDIKSAPYDTIQFRRAPSWLDKDCSEYGPSLFTSTGSRVPLISILLQVQLEAILWGVGTALGELPPYFISRAAYLSGRKLEVMEEVDTSKISSSLFEKHLNQLKKRLLLHAEHLNFLTILVLASVPNPLFDLAGIMCGQLGIPFWKFFSATVMGKAVIKTHIQSCFIISVCNNQLLDFIESKFLRVMSLVPGVASVLPNLIAKLHFIRAKYMEASPRGPSNMKGQGKWDLSLASIWNTIVLFILVNFLAKIINATAQSQMKKHHEMELAAIENRSQN